ncbi:type I-F CRISPR-associated endoribonuclease Cas6/Csy4 [Sulfurimonas sp.]|uniref:type I-F CRISPR-associated endoribonuclease Cas6/Csy4 n=1 Tax=Sulfurimonas sp. TaxID=2022749 RepID=UPI0019FB14D3|nr:type I-F CRISPR-associated endoribonuclease Cas6/Csy4 [Sulfurimonas sp.]MBE0515727.1 type I-F CRISPR-associated endoribonuclease Cas6/Csy4 [Sulfurimonas sp.]
MNYYIDIKLQGDTEISLGFIWQKIYAQMHLALVEHKDSEGMCSIGFAFPHYMELFPLGDMLRVFAPTKEELEILNIEEQLKKFSDYVIISDIKQVPTNIKGYVTFSRKQFKSNPERLARRYAKRHNKTLEEALSIYDDVSAKETKLPFVMMKSNSSNQQMKLFIEKNISDEQEKGLFSAYGLSKTSTVPYF